MEPVRLQWNSEAERSFIIKLFPYFRKVQCSVHECNNIANHLCEYALEDKSYSKLRRSKIYKPEIQKLFYLCQHHSKSQYIDLIYDSTRIVSI